MTKTRENVSKNLIYICKSKLVGIDSTLPAIMEIKSLYPKTNITFVFDSDKHLDLIKKNYNLWELIQSMGTSICVLRTRNKFIRLIRVIKFILRFLGKDNIIIKDGDTLPLHNIVMKILKRFSTVKEIKTFLRLRSLHGYKTCYIQEALTKEREGRPTRIKFFDGNYDYFLSVLNSAQFKEFFGLDAPKNKMVKAGYIRKLPQWQKYAEEAVKKNKAINDGPYFLYILTYMGNRAYRSYQEPERIELMEESLNVFKKYNTKIKTIFKPHAVTEVRKVEELLNGLNYSNYVIDYGHPMILSSEAKFVFGNNFSTTMFDAYYLGRPTVEYSQYDPELFIRAGKQSTGGSCCDFYIQRDQKKLEEILDKLINGNVNVSRDPKFIRENFPDTPPEFYEFLDKIFTQKD